jgi:hypothetical protein
MLYFICPKLGNAMKEKLVRSSNVPYFMTFCGLTTIPGLPLTRNCCSDVSLHVVAILIVFLGSFC